MEPTWTVTERRIKKFMRKQLKKPFKSYKKKKSSPKSNDIPCELLIYPYDDVSSEYVSDVTAESLSPASGESSVPRCRDNVGIHPLQYTNDMCSPIQMSRAYNINRNDELSTSTMSMNFVKEQISYSETSDDNNSLAYKQVRKISWADEQQQKDDNEDESTLVGLSFANGGVQTDNAATFNGENFAHNRNEEEIFSTTTTATSSRRFSDRVYLDDNNGAKGDVCSFQCNIS